MEFVRPVSLPVSKTDTMAVHKDELIQLIEELKNECSVMIRTFTGDKDRLKHAIINAEEQVSILCYTEYHQLFVYSWDGA